MTTTDPTIRFWNRIAPGYAKQPIKNESAYQEKLAITREYCTPTTRLLELGCGTGKTAVTLAPQVESVLATDFSPEMLSLGEQYAGEQNVSNATFSNIDAADIEIEKQFNIILAHSLTHLLENPDEFLTTVRDLLADDGVFLTNTVCLSEVAWFLKPIATLGRVLGLLPRLTFFSHDEYEKKLEKAGFTVERCYRPAKGTSFFVVRPNKSLDR